jgi:hypothetical protein
MFRHKRVILRPYIKHEKRANVLRYIFYPLCKNSHLHVLFIITNCNKLFLTASVV